MVDKELVKEKLDAIDYYYRQFEELLRPGITEIKKDFRTYYAIERLFILIVDEILDINLHFIKTLNFKTPDDLQSTFLILAENEVLPENFSKKIAPAVGLRNKLVHRYEKIDKELFLKTSKREKEDFKEYIKYILKYSEKI